jgi:hypothetical protein
MPGARGQAATTVDDSGRVYVIGGYVNGAESNTTFRFTPGSPGAWETLAPIPASLRGASAVYKSGKIYCFGGYNSAGPQSILLTYDLTANAWTINTLANLFWENASAVDSGGRIFVTGGEGGGGTQLLEFAPPTTLIARASMPTQHMEHGAAAFDGTVYVFGGATSGYNATAAVESYSLNTNAWSGAPADLPSPRTQFAYASSGQYVYVLGGSSNGGNYSAPIYDTTLSYNSSTNIWAAGPSLPGQSREGTAAVVGSRLYIFGGGNTSAASSLVFSIGIVGAGATVSTNAASSVTTTGVTLNGTVNANNASSAVSFDYGQTLSYGSNIAASPTPVTGSNNTAVSASVTGLIPNTTYHFRVKAVSSAGTSNGLDQTFTTLPNNNANLSNLALSSGTLSPAFAAATTSYTASVPNNVSSLTVTSTLADNTASVKVNNVTVASGSASGSIPLAVGANAITTVVTAQDGSTTKTYNVTVTRVASSKYLLVADGLSKSVLRLDATTGAETTFIAASNFNGYPSGMGIGPDGNLYVLDLNFSAPNCRVLKFNVSNGALIGTFANLGNTHGYFLAFDSAGNLYVQQDSSPYVTKYTSSGTLVGGIINSGTAFANTTVVGAFGMGIGPDDRIYLNVADSSLPSYPEDIVRFDLNGNYIDTLVNNFGNGNGYRKPLWDAQGNFYVCNLNDGVIRKFNGTTGALMQTIDPPGNGYVGMSFMPGGDLLVGSVWDNAIYRAKTDGTLLGTFATNIQAKDIVQQPAVAPDIAVEKPPGTSLGDGVSSSNFGTVTLGSTGSAVTFTIRNNGTENLVLGAITKDGEHPGDFAVSIPGSTTITAENTTTFTVSFTPGGSGLRSATIHIPSNVSGSMNPFDIILTGTGNTPPTFSGFTASTPYQTTATISLGKLLAKAADADGDALSVTDAGPSSTASGVAVLDVGSILYAPPDGFSGTDTFQVVITDARGAYMTGTVTITVQPNAAIGLNPPVLTPLSGGRMGLDFQGIPGRLYDVQRSTNLTTWQTLTTVTAATNGAVSFIDESPPPGSAFYRLRKP